MIKRSAFMLFSVILGVALLPLSAYSDYPHTGPTSGGIDCINCHTVHGDLPEWAAHTPVTIDDTYFNNLCWSCHNDVRAPYEKTHSSLTTNDNYGNWSVECRTCHNPHKQEQARSYDEAYPAGAYLYTGYSTAVGSNTITRTGAGWTADVWQGSLVIGDVAASTPVFYKITGNTADTLTVEGTITDVYAGDAFAIVYGTLVRSEINYVKSHITPTVFISSPVKFLTSTGPNSFADGTSTQAVCEVCHTKTKYHTNDGTGAPHNSGLDCVLCHRHEDGFKPGCEGCHGSPPTQASLGGPNGLTLFEGKTTGSSTPGKHALHAVTQGYSCTTCHSNFVMPQESTVKPGFWDITIGFNIFGATTGSYSGQTGVSYNNVLGSGGLTCSTVYCHSNVQGSGGIGSPTFYGSPEWDYNGSLTCGSCHANMAANPNAPGLHVTHAQSKGYPCSTCHQNAGAGTTNHANHGIDISFSVGGAYSLGASVAPGTSYANATCSGVACHADGKGNFTTTPPWGSTPTGSCTVCHAFPPPTGAHAAHVQDGSQLTRAYGNTEVKSVAGAYAFGCGVCHPTDPGKHANGVVDISLDPAEGGTLKSKNLQSAGRTGSGDATVCSGIYCHSNGATGGDFLTRSTPAWGGSFGANKCGSCHDNPPQYAGQAHYTETAFVGKEGGHLAGVHFDGIYNGTSGLASPGTGGNNSHGNQAYATVISCYLCHNGIVSSETIDTYALYNRASSAMKCANCHTAITPTPLQNGVITDKSRHVNGAKNVQLADNFTVKSKAQLRDGSTPIGWARTGGYKASGSYDSAVMNSSDWTGTTKTCVTACHNKSDITWNSTIPSCERCHTP